MQVTPDYLASLRASLEQQRLEAVARVNQLAGGLAAISLIEKHLAADEPDALSEDQLKTALGADEISVEPVAPVPRPNA